MTIREQLKARMIALHGMDAETGAHIAETIRRLFQTDVETELAWFLAREAAGRPESFRRK